MKTSAIAALPFFCMIPSAYAQSSTPRTVNDLVRAQSDVPVDGFGSISIYNAEGDYEKNEKNNYNEYSLNKRDGKERQRCGVTVRLGGRDGQALNWSQRKIYRYLSPVYHNR
ncbi:hypothetical protein PQQ88_32060 [Paraburkholderia caledonica]|jgi:hypothetical protein|uniref:hypothetical protein n=1 Tax=Paraburkholderia caledonica TaxID=134536 RepID=UPI0038BDA4EF